MKVWQLTTSCSRHSEGLDAGSEEFERKLVSLRGFDRWGVRERVSVATILGEEVLGV